jgi:CRISPR system Cascade subunit CasD
MKTVLLRLEGPLQAWGTQGRFSIRETDGEPSKSGILGLVAAALGMARDNAQMLSRLVTLRLAIRVDREGRPLRDYHTAGGGKFRGQKYAVWARGNKEGEVVVTQRHYLADASFVAALGGEDLALVDQIAKAVQDPVWPLFLGRKACVPSAPLFEGVVNCGPEDAVRGHPIIAVPAFSAIASRRIRLVLEASPDAVGARPRHDVPLSFALYDRRHTRRFVTVEWMSVPPPLEVAS